MKFRRNSGQEQDDKVIRVKRPLGGETRENQKNRRKKAHIKTFWVLFLLVLIVSLSVGVYVYRKMRRYRGYKVIRSTELQYEATAEYIEFGGNLLKYTPEGVSYINANGDMVWTTGIDLKVPIAKVKGDYAVIGDKGGNTVCVFSTAGEVGKVTMPYEIRDIDVCKTGAFTVILESDEVNYINMYSSTGEKIYEMQTSIDRSGYPIDMTISDDGQKLFTSYFRLDGVNIVNQLTAYNFGEVGQNTNADRMVGGFTFDDEMIPKVEFLTNSCVAAFTDQEIKLYTMKEKPTEKATIAYDGEVIGVFYSSSYVGIVQKNPDANVGGYLMKVYDTSGKELFQYPFSIEYERIYAAKNEIIVTGGNQCLIVTKSGRTKFSYAFSSMIKSMVPAAKRNQYIVTFEDRTETIKLTTEDK